MPCPEGPKMRPSSIPKVWWILSLFRIPLTSSDESREDGNRIVGIWTPIYRAMREEKAVQLTAES
jgi:hypothetical protein